MVLLHAAGFLQIALARQSVYLYAPIYFVLLAGIGLFKQWGPPVLFTLGGFCITFYWQLFTPAFRVYVNPIESVMPSLGYPTFCAVFGFGFGLCIESLQKLKKGPANVRRTDIEDQPPAISRK